MAKIFKGKVNQEGINQQIGNNKHHSTYLKSNSNNS